MTFLLLLLSFLAFWPLQHLHSFVAEVSKTAHQICLTPLMGTAHFSINSALMCGASLTEATDRHLFVQVGLYHLLVVSGSHLSFLQRGINRLFPTWQKRVVGILFVYALASLWQPPVVRALLQLGLKMNSKRRTPLIFRSWLLCLALHPLWIHSLSLHLSALAASVVARWQDRDPVHFQLVMAIFLCPLLLGWSPLHPFVFVLAIFTGPISLLIWTLTLLIELAFPPELIFWTERVAAWNQILRSIAEINPLPEKPFAWQVEGAWVYVLLFFLADHFLSCRSRQKNKKGLG